MNSLELTERQIDLWHVFTEKITDPALWDAYRELLSQEEAQRERDFIHKGAQRQFLLGRALLRTALARYTGDNPKAVRFSYNRHGKPALDSSGVPLEFSLSHTRGLVVCAVALRDALGVDVEDQSQPSSLTPLELAQRYFAPAETAALAQLPAEERLPAFLDLWTLKEAFLKARGTGLMTPLADFAFSISSGRPPTISFSSPEQDRPDDWQFAHFCLEARHHIALAAHRPATSPSHIVFRESTPLL
jgi:4'-phosphopantetheinyl transferase